MNAERCENDWMAAAADDGRLTGEQRAAFARHADHCARCRQEAIRLARLRELMARIPEPVAGDLHHHRSRQRLLARAAGQPEAASRRWTAYLVTVAAALLVAGAGIGLAIRRSAHPAPIETAEAPRYEVTGLENAAWTNEEAGATARVRLTHGSAAFHVSHLASGQRFLVTLPDGEIEVRGTRFVVDVEDGRTRYIVVIEGKVAVRPSGAGERLLLAGDRWDLAPGATARSRPAPEPAVALAIPPTAAAAAPATKPAPRHEGAVTAAAETTASTASSLFAQGIQAFRAGNYLLADHLWQAFAARNPRDPRVEDAAFLRAVGRSRLGDDSGAAELARAYLAAFPRGMRRQEAQVLILRTSPAPAGAP